MCKMSVKGKQNFKGTLVGVIGNVKLLFSIFSSTISIISVKLMFC